MPLELHVKLILVWVPVVGILALMESEIVLSSQIVANIVHVE